MWEKSFVGRHVKVKCPTVLGEYVPQDILFHLSPSNVVIWAMKTTIRRKSLRAKRARQTAVEEDEREFHDCFAPNKGKRTIKVDKLKSDSPVK